MSSNVLQNSKNNEAGRLSDFTGDVQPPGSIGFLGGLRPLNHGCWARWRRNQYAPGELNQRNQNKIMGDKSPKSNQKQSKQKQVKVSSVAAAKKQAVAAKRNVVKKK